MTVSLIERLGLGSLFTHFSSFDQTQPLFQACLTVLHTHEDKDTILYLYDRLFTENLNWIRALAPIHPSSLQSFDVTPQEMHDLILYLAWDRMCICISRLFDHQSSDAKFISGLEVLKECLIESYQHITQQGQTSPSIYRLFEALFFYFMREEQWQKNSPSEWAILTQSFSVLKGEEELGRVSYIDDAVSRIGEPVTSERYLTSDSPDKIKARLAFANFMMEKLKLEIPGWNYYLAQKEIISLSQP